MKKYLFGLGAMLFGAGLMFGFTHTEVSAESEAKKADTIQCEVFQYSNQVFTPRILGRVNYCKFKDVTCVVLGGSPDSISCTKE
jgi:hypothetical protein